MSQNTLTREIAGSAFCGAAQFFIRTLKFAEDFPLVGIPAESSALLASSRGDISSATFSMPGHCFSPILRFSIFVCSISDQNRNPL